MFVDLNPLRWARKSFSTTIYNDMYLDTNFKVNIMNTSGVAHTYTIENLPRWLTVDTATDVLEPKSERTLTFIINKDANVVYARYIVDHPDLTDPMLESKMAKGSYKDALLKASKAFEEYFKSIQTA